MKNKILTISFLILSHIGFAQTLEETANWIENNAGAPNSMFSNTVFYNAQTHKLLLYKNYSAPFKFRKVTEINPAHVSSISTFAPNKKASLGGIVINFKNGGTNTKIYLANNNTRLSKVKKVEEKQMSSLPIMAEGGINHYQRIKRYYINLFQQLGIEVKDGDNLSPTKL